MTVRVNKSAFNIREKLSELERPIGVKGNELMRAETAQEARDLVSAGRKNLIINGDFQVSQRGSYTSATAVSQNTYYLDRWKVDISGVTGTIQQLTNQTISSDSHIKNTVKMAATSTATAYIQLRQYVELNPALYGKTVTVSAWVKSNRSTRLRLESAYYGGSNWDSLTAHSGNGQWEKLSMTIRLQTSPSNIIFGVVMWGGSGGTTGGTTSISSGDYFEFTDFQVEVGKNATEFEHRSYSEELALCQRYYQKSYPTEVTPGSNVTASLGFAGMEGRTGMSGVSSSGEHFRGTKLFPSMRTTPNVTVYDRVGNAGKITGTKYLVADTDNITGPVQNVCATGFQVKCINAGDFGGISFHYTADAEL